MIAAANVIDPYSRLQPNLYIQHLYPNKKDGLCGCGCGKKLTGRRTRWASKECSYKAVTRFFIIKGQASVIRRELSKRERKENGGLFCANCGMDLSFVEWQADHIKEVRHGGGGCELDNYQPLDLKCHKIKTKQNFK